MNSLFVRNISGKKTQKVQIQQQQNRPQSPKKAQIKAASTNDNLALQLQHSYKIYYVQYTKQTNKSFHFQQ